MAGHGKKVRGSILEASGSGANIRLTTPPPRNRGVPTTESARGSRSQMWRGRCRQGAMACRCRVEEQLMRHSGGPPGLNHRLYPSPSLDGFRAPQGRAPPSPPPAGVKETLWRPCVSLRAFQLPPQWLTCRRASLATCRAALHSWHAAPEGHAPDPGWRPSKIKRRPPINPSCLSMTASRLAAAAPHLRITARCLSAATAYHFSTKGCLFDTEGHHSVTKCRLSVTASQIPVAAPRLSSIA